MTTESPNLPSPELVFFQRARTGDFAAFEQLLERLQPRVFGVAFRILGNVADAEDIVQQTYLSVIEHLDGFRGDSSVGTWVLRIATNFALKVLRKRRGLPTVSMDSSDDTFASVPHPEFIAPWREKPEDLLARKELREVLDRAIAELDDPYRVVFVLRDIEELSTRETAEAVGISEANVKVRLLRARLQLREKLTRLFGDEAARVYPDHSHTPGTTS